MTFGKPKDNWTRYLLKEVMTFYTAAGPNLVVQWLSFVLRIKKIPGLNLGQ